MKKPEFLNISGKRVDIRMSLISISKAECESDLTEFIKQAWHVVEPGQPYLHNWHIDLIAEHLTAITDELMLDDERYYNRLLINVPPGAMKSLLVNVFWPAWEWGPCDMPHLRYVCASHSMSLSMRDSVKMRRLVSSEWYQERWGDRVVLTGDQNEKIKFENTASGFRQAIAMTSMTGSRGDRVIIDDPHSVASANSEAERLTTTETFEQAIPTRLNNPDKSAIIVIMQRLHEEDVSGLIISKQLGYDHIMIPMEYDPDRATPTLLGAEDPRVDVGELFFPERFPRHVVDRDKKLMGTYAVSGQFQQTPTPSDGGIIKARHWQLWENSVEFPAFDYIVAALDTAYTEKTENDPSAMTVWGVFTDDPVAQAAKTGKGYAIERTYKQPHPKVMLIYAWQERLELNDLVAKVLKTCKQFPIDTVLVEDKAAGKSIVQELRRVTAGASFGIQEDPPGSQDKRSRLYSVQHLFEEGLIYAPDKDWADEVIQQCVRFPKAKHDDLVDTVSMAMRYLRRTGLIQRAEEVQASLQEMSKHSGKPPAPLYGI
jgi:predicted phage terminase large subunit-like protein